MHEHGDEKTFVVMGKLMHIKHITHGCFFYFIFLPKWLCLGFEDIENQAI